MSAPRGRATAKKGTSAVETAAEAAGRLTGGAAAAVMSFLDAYSAAVKARPARTPVERVLKADRVETIGSVKAGLQAVLLGGPPAEEDAGGPSAEALADVETRG